MDNNLNNADFLLQNLMDNMTDRIYFKDRQSCFIMVNKSFLEWHGLDSSADAMGKTDFDFFSDVHAGKAFADEQKIIQTGEPLLGMEEEITWQDGWKTWASTTKMPLRDQAGEIIGTFGISRDITDHKKTEFRAARYAEQIRCIKEEMEEDVRMAGELQKTFFPRSYPCFPAGAPPAGSCVDFFHHYRASGLVSGDFCAIRRLSETQVGIFLCDVMGHGVRAALGTALIYAMGEESSDSGNDPGLYLSRINDLLLPILQQDDIFLFATACYLVFDAATGFLRFANAGHPVPLHFQASENRAVWLTDDNTLRGPALAIVEGAEFSTGTAQLQPGDSIVAFTDGLYEVLNDSDEEFGEDRLLAAAQPLTGLPPDELLPALLDAASRFAGEGGFNDDVCMVGFRMKRLMPAGEELR